MSEFENVKMILEEVEEDEYEDEDEIELKNDFVIDGEYMDLRLFPQFIMYKALGADWIAEKNNITDPLLYGICQELAKQPMKTLGEQWEDQKQLRSEVVEKNYITNIDKLYTE